MAKKKVKKYGNGTPVTNYIDNPAEVLQQNSIDIANAQYEAANAPIQHVLKGVQALTQNEQIMGMLTKALGGMGSGGASMATGGEVGEDDLTTLRSQDLTNSGMNIANPQNFNLLEGDALQNYIKNIAPDPKTRQQVLGGARVWADPSQPDFYVIGGGYTAPTPTPTTPAEPQLPVYRNPHTNEPLDVSIYGRPEGDIDERFTQGAELTTRTLENIAKQKAQQEEAIRNNNAQSLLSPEDIQIIKDRKITPIEYLKEQGRFDELDQIAKPGPVPTGAYGLDLSYAFGGNIPVEIEGEEVIETPDGNVEQVKGPTHEDGGIKTELPQGTKVYSDRIKIQGETMQERKLGREKKQSKIEDLLDLNSSDSILKSTLARVTTTNNAQEEKDMNLQKVIDTIMGGQPTKFANGSVVGEPPYNPDNPMIDYFATMLGEQIDPTLLNPKTMDDLGAKSGDVQFRALGEIPISDLPVKGLDTMGAKSGEILPPDYNPTMNPKSTSSVEEDGKSGNLNDIFASTTPGDLTSMAGVLYSSFAPYINTLRNRATDTPNINPYRDFGVDALKNVDEMKGYVDQITNEKLKDLELARVGATKRNRNSARGINTLRALDLATDMGANSEQSAIYNQAAQMMMSILGQEAQLNNVQDQMVMQGEGMRDLADRQDKDNFYTQKGVNLAGIGEGIQELGKDFNDAREREYINNLLTELSKYGITVDNKGNITQG